MNPDPLLPSKSPAAKRVLALLLRAARTKHSARTAWRRHIDDLYGDLWASSDPGFESRVNQSLNPRAFGILHEAFGALGVGKRDTILDIGCRYADAAIRLVQRFGCRAVAIDPVALHLEKARKAAARGKKKVKLSELQKRKQSGGTR